jgi:hypothetical protein
MGPAATTALGTLAGLILFLAMAFAGVIAVNGVNNPGIAPAEASAGAGSTGEAYAVDTKSPSMRALDLNHDGKLSLAEAAGYAEIVTRFDRADRNKDGKLSKAEFERLAKLPPPKAAKTRSAKARRSAPTLEELSAAAGG